MREKAESAARRKAEDKERQRQMEMDEYLAGNKKGTLPNHVRLYATHTDTISVVGKNIIGKSDFFILERLKAIKIMKRTSEVAHSNGYTPASISNVKFFIVPAYILFFVLGKFFLSSMKLKPSSAFFPCYMSHYLTLPLAGRCI